MFIKPDRLMNIDQLRMAMPASAASAPGSVALLDRALACPVCGESVGGTPALCCAQCTCGPFRAQCAQPVAVCFTGAAEGAQEVRAQPPEEQVQGLRGRRHLRA